MDTKFLFIVRGLPGSGKSTLAKKIAAAYEAEHWEADQYFTDSNGNYKFNANDISAAHEYCTRGVIDALNHSRRVVVSNTFTRPWEMEDYLTEANRLGYSVWIIECTESYGSVHDVPELAMQKMKQRWVSNAEFKRAMIGFDHLYPNLKALSFQNANDWDFHS